MERNLEPLITALSVVAIAAYLVVLWWAIVAYLEDVRAGRDRNHSRADLVTSGALVLLAFVAFVYGGDPARIALQLLAAYRLVEGPAVRRSP